MSLKPYQKAALGITLSAIVGFTSVVLWKRFRPVPGAPVKTYTIQVPVTDPQQEAAPPQDPDCNWQNTHGSGSEVPPIPAHLVFETRTSQSEAFGFNLPFALKEGQTFSFERTFEIGSEFVAACRTVGSSVRCSETFSSERQILCASLEKADGQKDWVKLIVNIDRKKPTLPADLASFAVKEETPALGIMRARKPDEEKSKAAGLPVYNNIQIWESAEPGARLLGEVPSGFFLYDIDPKTVYVAKVGDRYLSNVLGVPGAYHWVSQVEGTAYEDYVRGVSVCAGADARYCTNPSEKDCQPLESDLTTPDPTVDEKEPILQNEKRWVVLNRDDKTKVYVELMKYTEYMSAGCS